MCYLGFSKAVLLFMLAKDYGLSLSVLSQLKLDFPNIMEEYNQHGLNGVGDEIAVPETCGQEVSHQP